MEDQDKPEFLDWDERTLLSFFDRVKQGASLKAQASLVHLSQRRLKHLAALATEALNSGREDEYSLTLAEFATYYHDAAIHQEMQALEAINQSLKIKSVSTALAVLRSTDPAKWDRSTHTQEKLTQAKIQALAQDNTQTVLLPAEILAALPEDDRLKVKKILARNNLAILEKPNLAKGVSREEAMKLLDL